MATRKTASARSVRQSVTIPATLIPAVRHAEAEAKELLKSSYDRFLAENEPCRKNEAGKDLIRAIFGKDAKI